MSAHYPDFDKRIKRISERKWSEISSLWLNFIPDIEKPGTQPENSIASLLDGQEIVKSLEYSSEKRDELDGLRPDVLREGIFLLHKASHVIAASEIHAKEGLRTWALSSAYQGAYFAQKAIMMILGIGIADVANDTILIDVWPGPNKGERKQKSRMFPRNNEMQFMKFRKLDHWRMWAIFQRVLRVTDVGIWDNSTLTSLQEIESRDFSRQRNRLHYENNLWIFNDLHVRILDDDLSEILVRDEINSQLVDGSKFFSFALAATLFRMGWQLLSSIAPFSEALRAEVELLRTTLEAGHHPYFSEYVEDCLVI